VHKPVSILSGGEKTRLALARILVKPPNLLLMDEPTTHLDIQSIDALVHALKSYEGTLIFISHDVHFIKTLAKNVLHVHSGKLTPYAGDYDYYLDKSKSTDARAALTSGLSDSRPKQAAAPAKAAAPPPPPAPKNRRRTKSGSSAKKSASLRRKSPSSKRSRPRSPVPWKTPRPTPTKESFTISTGSSAPSSTN
jgi:ATP-binding cassette subfamily F protein 3